MQIGILGINYKSSTLHLRELVARSASRLFGNESKIAARLSCVLLSTCNRTEIYFSSHKLADAHGELLKLLRREMPDRFEHHLYSYFGRDCFFHLCRVTAGLDSAVIAETEVQRQVKTAYGNAALDHTLTSEMHFLFQKALKVGKTVRSSYSFHHKLPTLENLIYELSRQFSERSSVFFLGNSEINRKILTFFRAKGMQEITLCTRGVHSAQEFAARQPCKVLDWEGIKRWQEADILICGSNHREYLILPEQVDLTCRTRAIFDLGVPRNVDPRLKRHPSMTVFNIEELDNLIAHERGQQMKGIEEAEKRLRRQTGNQIALFHKKCRVISSLSLS